jgi:hypothetical protein
MCNLLMQVHQKVAGLAHGCSRDLPSTLNSIKP